MTNLVEVKPANEVLFSQRFRPVPNWEQHQQYVLGLHFLSADYLEAEATDDQLRSWRGFFKAGGVRESPDNGVEDFAVAYAIERLGSICGKVTRVEKRNYGYDLWAVTNTGENMHVEVKGLSSDNDVELTGNETEAADHHGDTFYLCVVASIPDKPAAYLIRNPSRLGKKDKLTIPISIWKTGPAMTGPR